MPCPTWRPIRFSGLGVALVAAGTLLAATPAGAAIRVLAVASSHAGVGNTSPAVSSLTYSLTIPDGNDRLLVVSVLIGDNSSPCIATSPTVASVTYGKGPLNQITAIVGTPECDGGAPRSEQWWLAAPATGPHDVVVTLSDNAQTIHSGAMAFEGVDQFGPVRNFASAIGRSRSSSVHVPSSDGDLVVNTVGQGDGIFDAGTGQTLLFIQNGDSSNTLNNSAASTAPGASGGVTMTWTFWNIDSWQTISSSLQPAGASTEAAGPDAAVKLVYVARPLGCACQSAVAAETCLWGLVGLLAAPTRRRLPARRRG